MTLEVGPEGDQQSNRQRLTSKIIHSTESGVSQVFLVRVQDLTENLQGEFGKVRAAQEILRERCSILGKN